MILFLISDAVTGDGTVKKVFLPSSAPHRPCRSVAPCHLSLLFISLLYKCHKCHRPLFAGGSLVTLLFPSLSPVTTFSTLYAGDYL